MSRYMGDPIGSPMMFFSFKQRHQEFRNPQTMGCERVGRSSLFIIFCRVVFDPYLLKRSQPHLVPSTLPMFPK